MKIKKIKVRKSITIFLIIISIIVLSLLAFPKDIYKFYNNITSEECINLNSSDIIILNDFLKGTYNGDIKYWCELRKINPRFLHDKNLSIPKELGKLTNLYSIILSGKGLSGEIPKELGNLSKLKVLSLNNNNLSGEIPKELGQLKNIEFFNLLDNKLSLDIPKELQELQNNGKWEYFKY